MLKQRKAWFSIIFRLKWKTKNITGIISESGPVRRWTTRKAWLGSFEGADMGLIIWTGYADRHNIFKLCLIIKVMLKIAGKFIFPLFSI